MELSERLKTIPKSRLILYILGLGLIPLLGAAYLFMSKLEELNDLHNSLQGLKALSIQREKKQAGNIALRNYYREANHFYIDKNIENIRLLQPEIEGLKKAISNPNFPEDPNIRKRLEVLTGPQNHISFSEGAVQSNPFFQETLESLVHPVEININDLQKILSAVEGVEIGPYSPEPGRPQLIIIDFKLDKKSLSDKNEVFGLNMKLLKREFL